MKIQQCPKCGGPVKETGSFEGAVSYKRIPGPHSLHYLLALAAYTGFGAGLNQEPWSDAWHDSELHDNKAWEDADQVADALIARVEELERSHD